MSVLPDAGVLQSVSRGVEITASGMAEKEVVQVAAAVIERGGRYLITCRETDVHLGGYWEFPGGKREVDETFEACARREVFEELGIAITAPRPLTITRYDYSDKSVELHFFTCSLSHGDPRPLGCVDFRWVKPEELAEYSFPPADVPVVAHLMKLAEGRDA